MYSKMVEADGTIHVIKDGIFDDNKGHNWLQYSRMLWHHFFVGEK